VHREEETDANPNKARSVQCRHNGSRDRHVDAL
jgi:hypothetical protein